jgi:hemerythrin superfamily protein
MTAKKTTAKPARKTAAKTATGPDAIALLIADHKEVKGLFKKYQKLVDSEAGDSEKGELAQQICTMLTVHAQIEEEIFYPATREVLDEQDLVDEAAVEHASAKDLIAQIESMTPGDDLYDAKVKVLGEYIDHHVEEEEGEMFPKAKKAGLDVAEIGGELETRKAELREEMTATA